MVVVNQSEENTKAQSSSMALGALTAPTTEDMTMVGTEKRSWSKRVVMTSEGPSCLSIDPIALSEDSPLRSSSLQRTTNPAISNPKTNLGMAPQEKQFSKGSGSCEPNLPNIDLNMPPPPESPTPPNSERPGVTPPPPESPKLPPDSDLAVKSKTSILFWFVLSPETRPGVAPLPKINPILKVNSEDCKVLDIQMHIKKELSLPSQDRVDVSFDGRVLDPAIPMSYLMKRWMKNLESLSVAERFQIFTGGTAKEHAPALTYSRRPQGALPSHSRLGLLIISSDSAVQPRPGLHFFISSPSSSACH